MARSGAAAGQVEDDDAFYDDEFFAQVDAAVDAYLARQKEASSPASPPAHPSPATVVTNRRSDATLPPSQTDAESDRSLKYLSYNVAELKPSAEAPPGWTSQDTWARVQALVARERPDFIHLQEMPCPPSAAHTLPGYTALRTAVPSHCGFVVTYVRTDRLGDLESTHGEVLPQPFEPMDFAMDFVSMLSRMARGPPTDLPAVIWRWRSGLRTVNVHLAPFQQGREQRLEELSAVAEACRGHPTFVVGDTNTRKPEWGVIASQLGLGGQPPPAYTWDSYANRFHSDRKVAFRCTFSRSFHTSDVAASSVRVLQDKVEAMGRRFNLSDHYPMVGEIRLVPRRA